MQRLSRRRSCMLLVLGTVINVALASGGGKVPVYPRVCVGEEPKQCCKTDANIDFTAICSKQLEIFPGGVDLDSPEAALVAASLVSSITNVSWITDEEKRDAAACVLRNRLSQIGADFRSVKFYFFNDRVAITTAPATVDITFLGGALLFAAGPNVYIVFSGVQRGGKGPPKSGFPNYPIKYKVDGNEIGTTNDLWLSYYQQAFRTTGYDIIEDALELLSDDSWSPSKKDQGFNSFGRKLYIAGWSAGGVASIYASFDLIEEGQQTAAHVYLFGNPKPGDTDFVEYYLKTPNGFQTSDWWNKLDITPLLPSDSNTEQTQLRSGLKTKDDKDTLDGWGVVNNPKYVRLPGELYWRIVGTKDGDVRCVKVTSSADPFYSGCPDKPTTLTCGLNFDDHFYQDYQSNIKKCVLPKRNTFIRRRRYAYNPTCINDVRISP